MAAPTAPEAPESQTQGRSWRQTIFQIILFQMVMRFFTRPQPKMKDPVTGKIIPPFKNAFSPGTNYDVFVYISSNKSAALEDWEGKEPLWFIPSQVYTHDKKSKALNLEPFEVNIEEQMFNTLVKQHLILPSDEEDTDSEDSTGATNTSSLVQGMIKKLKRPAIDMKKKYQRMEQWSSLYLHSYAVPHFAYETLPSSTTKTDAAHSIGKIKAPFFVASGVSNLIEYMKPIKEAELQSLLGGDTGDDEIETKKNSVENSTEVIEQPHWKNHLDIRMVIDHSDMTSQNLMAPHIRKYMRTLPDKKLYLPIIHGSDLWLLERNLIELNETTRSKPMNLTLSFNSITPWWWMIQTQMNTVWNPQGGEQLNPLLAFQTQSKRETFMFKRIILDTNPYLLGFSAGFMILHTVFSMLAFKNDIQFWRNNESMRGLSALSVLFSFFCEIVIALYLYDSEQTSFLILMEIFVGVAISAWKVTKALSISLSWRKGITPQLEISDKNNYEESNTKHYDRVAIKFMSIIMLPCAMGYAFYSLKTKKHKSWYSFIVSSLAGTVYTFGFILMTPQLYINYKLKSVDHLPWRAFTYKALNTFVDDIAAFVIDMPWMHRLACFRDDIIFVCYLYQRWIYSVDKTRPSEWIDKAEYERQQLLHEQRESITAADSGLPSEASAVSKEDTLRKRKMSSSVNTTKSTHDQISTKEEEKTEDHEKNE